MVWRAPNKRDVKLMVAALFTMNAGLERARRQRKGAATLNLLQTIANHDGARPSDIAVFREFIPHSSPDKFENLKLLVM